MRAARFFPALVLALIVVFAGLARWRVVAQEEGKVPKGRNPSPPATKVEPMPEADSTLPSGHHEVSVQDALLLPFDLPFGRETTLEEVAKHLQRNLHAQVVLDVGALERQDLTASDTVKLQLRGVRLKTALKLLLGQVGLTYRVIPEDNLLILTDAQESDDRYAHILDELKALHRDVHSLQDSVDELLEDTGVEKKGAGHAVQISGAVARGES